MFSFASLSSQRSFWLWKFWSARSLSYQDRKHCHFFRVITFPQPIPADLLLEQTHLAGAILIKWWLATNLSNWGHVPKSFLTYCSHPPMTSNYTWMCGRCFFFFTTAPTWRPQKIACIGSDFWQPKQCLPCRLACWFHDGTAIWHVWWCIIPNIWFLVRCCDADNRWKLGCLSWQCTGKGVEKSSIYLYIYIHFLIYIYIFIYIYTIIYIYYYELMSCVFDFFVACYFSKLWDAVVWRCVLNVFVSFWFFGPKTWKTEHGLITFLVHGARQPGRGATGTGKNSRESSRLSLGKQPADVSKCLMQGWLT